MPNINELTPYYGQYTGYQFDTAIGRALNPEMDVAEPSTTTDASLASVVSVKKSRAEDFTVASITNMTVSGSFSKTFTQASDNYPYICHITQYHHVVGWEISNPAAITSDLTWATGDGQITLSGTGNGTTNIKLYLEYCEHGLNMTAV